MMTDNEIKLTKIIQNQEFIIEQLKELISMLYNKRLKEIDHVQYFQIKDIIKQYEKSKDTNERIDIPAQIKEQAEQFIKQYNLLGDLIND